MCYKVESPFVLIHQLKDKNSISIKEIVSVKNKIEKELPSVFVDVSKRSILQTISSYPEIFKWENNQVVKRASAEKYFNDSVIDYFNVNLDEELKNKIISIFQVGN